MNKINSLKNLRNCFFGIGLFFLIIRGCNHLSHYNISPKGDKIVSSKGLFGKIEYIKKKNEREIVYFPGIGFKGYKPKIKCVDINFDNKLDYIITRDTVYNREESYENEKKLFNKFERILKNFQKKRIRYLTNR